MFWYLAWDYGSISDLSVVTLESLAVCTVGEFGVCHHRQFNLRFSGLNLIVVRPWHTSNTNDC